VLQRITRKSGISVPAQAPPGGPKALLERLRGSLPVELRAHLQQVLLRSGELVVFTESAVWAGQLRVAVAELRQAGVDEALPELASHPRLTLRVLPREGFRR
jgi:hypothetical protein